MTLKWYRNVCLSSVCRIFTFVLLRKKVDLWSESKMCECQCLFLQNKKQATAKQPPPKHSCCYMCACCMHCRCFRPSPKTCQHHCGVIQQTTAFDQCSRSLQQERNTVAQKFEGIIATLLWLPHSQ